MSPDPTAATGIPDKARIDVSTVRSVLVYGVMGIGDMIMLSPALRALRAGLPEAHITLLIEPGRAAEAPIEGSNLVDALLPLPPAFRRGLPLIPWVWRNVRGRFDLHLIPPHGTAITLAPITVLSGAPHRVAITLRNRRRARLPFIYNHRVEVPWIEHGSRSHARLVEYLGIPVEDYSPLFALSDDDRQRAADHLRAKGLEATRPRIAIHAGSSAVQPWKRWPEERFAALIQRLRSELGAQVLLVGSGSERAELTESLGAIAGEAAIVAGEMDIKASAALLESCDLAIANDSGIGHIAAAVGTPLVALFGPTNEQVCGPMSEQARVLTADVPCRPCYLLGIDGPVQACRDRICLTGVSVDTVFAACTALLGGT